jgi:hypothetical protein
MYIGAVLNAVKDVLVNSALSELVKPNEIVISEDGSAVHPAIGQRFVSIHPIDRTNPLNITGQVYSDQLTFGVTVGIQSREIPKDRLPEYLYSPGRNGNSNTSIDLLRDLIIIIINNSNSSIVSNIVTSINSSILALPSNLVNIINNNNISIVDRVRYLSTDASPVLRYPEYFKSTQSIDDEPRPAGMTLTTVFLAPKLLANLGC